MQIAPDIGTQFSLGSYTVLITLRKDNPAWARYLVFKGEDLIGAQFSRPCLSDCRWLEHQVYAESSVYLSLEKTKGKYQSPKHLYSLAA